jgi:hypothetical protein
MGDISTIYEAPGEFCGNLSAGVRAGKRKARDDKGSVVATLASIEF